MSYLLVNAEESFFGTPFFFLNPGARPKPTIVGVTLKNTLKRYKADYQKEQKHLPFSVYFQRSMNILERDTAKVTLQTFFAQFLQPFPDQKSFNTCCAIVDGYTPVLLKQMFREISINIARIIYPADALFSFALQDIPLPKKQGHLAKLLHVFQNKALESNEVNQFLVDLFLAYQIPQPVIDFEVAVVRAFMKTLSDDLEKKNLILNTIREWKKYSDKQKILFLQTFVEWHSAAFNILAPKILTTDFESPSFRYMKGSHQILISSLDIKGKHVVDLMLLCLHENICNYQTHLYHDFDQDSKRNPLRISSFYKELCDIKEVRQYVKTLYLSALNYQIPAYGIDFYYLQPFKFHAFTHEFLFATLFLEEFSKFDSSQTLFLFQKIALLFYRQDEGYQDVVKSLLANYGQGAIYKGGPLSQIVERVMPRYSAFLEVYYVSDGGAPSLRKAFDELERYGNAFQKLLPKGGRIVEIGCSETDEERVERKIKALLDDDTL